MSKRSSRRRVGRILLLLLLELLQILDSGCLLEWIMMRGLMLWILEHSVSRGMRSISKLRQLLLLLLLLELVHLRQFLILVSLRRPFPAAGIHPLGLGRGVGVQWLPPTTAVVVVAATALILPGRRGR